MKRSELYSAVWSQAPALLAAQLGMSDTALRALCRKHEVPVPPRGYWAKVAAGKPVERAVLLTPDEDPEIALRAPPPAGRLEAQLPARPSTASSSVPPPQAGSALASEIQLEVCRGALVVRATWQASAAKECASWVSSLLKSASD